MINFKLLFVVLIVLNWSSSIAQSDSIEVRDVINYSLDIGGDYNGDGIQEAISTHYTFPDGQLIDSIIYNGSHKSFKSNLCALKPQLRLTSQNLNGTVISEDCNTFEIYALMTLGDINRVKGDEIALVLGNEDFPDHYRCHLYSYCNDQWQQILNFPLDGFYLYGLGGYGTLEFEPIGCYFYIFGDDSYKNQIVKKDLALADCQ